MQRFIDRLRKLNREDYSDRRAALATLRRALSGETSDVNRAHRYIGYWLPSYWEAQDTCIMLAALFAHHPLEGEEGNMGSHLAALVKANPDRARAAARRFTDLVAAHREDLPRRLRQAVSMLAKEQIPVNWFRLLKDIDVNRWNHEDQYVQRNWANAFWRNREVTAVLNKSS